ncbi:MAG: FkbM family methyltransferase [Deltaproteobacteria bacterium]|nr:FkbM family methyltransferase [Deltaproteobacteria bacterium]
MEANQFTEEIMRGEKHLQHGRIDEALEIFESLLEKDPDNVFVLNDKGVILNRLGRYGEAIQLFLVALQKDKNNSNAAFNLIANYIAINNLVKAEAVLEEYRHCLPANDIEMITNDLQRFRSSDRDMSGSQDSKIAELSVSFNSCQYSLKISLDLTQFSQKIMWNCLNKGQLYEPGTSHFLASALREGDSFIDIGSHIGYFSLLASIIVGSSGQVFAIEPELSNFDRLTTNISLNKFSNIKTFNVALGSKIEQKQFFVNTDNDGGHALWNVGLHPFNKNSRANPVVRNIKTATLDSLFEDNDPDSLKLIKIDTEGSECAILQGGANMMSRQNVPYLICEINRFALQQMGTSEKELRLHMEQSGYETYLLNDENQSFTRLSKDDYIETNYVFNVVFSKAGDPNVPRH